jgi:hypothetical protein
MSADWWGQCARKAFYPSRAPALTALLQQSDTKRGLVPYRCPAGCGGWHLGRDGRFPKQENRSRANRTRA